MAPIDDVQFQADANWGDKLALWVKYQSLKWNDRGGPGARSGFLNGPYETGLLDPNFSIIYNPVHGYSPETGPNGIVPGSREVDKAPGADLAPARDLKTFAERLSKMPLDLEPGARWQYAVGIDLMGYVIQTVTKTLLSDYMHKTIFAPLKMVDTDFIVPAGKVSRFASA